MLTWQRLTYGALAAAGIVVTGLTIYQGAPRRQIQPVDVIELVEGVQERLAALQTGTALVYRVSTNWVDVWHPDGSGLQYQIPNGTNAPVYTNYLAWSGTNAVITTNLTFGFEAWRSFPVQVGRFVWGGWDRFTVSGFDDYWGMGGIDGTFQWATQTEWGVIFTNRTPTYPDWTYVLVDRGPSVGWRIETPFVWSTNDLPGDWDYDGSATYWTIDHARRSFSGAWDGYSTTGAVSASGTINSNRVRDAAAVVYESEMNAIGATVPYSLMTNLDGQIKALVPRYVNDSLMSNGTFDAWFAINSNATTFPTLTVTGLWARLGIGDKTNRFSREPARLEPAHTNWVYAYTTWFPGGAERAVCYTAEVNREVNYASAWDGSNYTWSVYSGAVAHAVAFSNVPATYGNYPWVVYTNDLNERFQVLAALRVTARTGQWASVVWTNWSTNLNVSLADTRDEDGTPCAPTNTPAWWQNTDGGGAFWSPASLTVNGTEGLVSAVTTSRAAPEMVMDFLIDYAKWESWGMASPWGQSVWTLNESGYEVNRSLVSSNALDVILPAWPTNLTAWVDLYAAISGIPSSTQNLWTVSALTSVTRSASAVLSNTATTVKAGASAPSWHFEGTNIAVAVDGETGGSGAGYCDHQWYHLQRPVFTNASVRQYYGARLQSPTALIRWQFTRCTNAP